VIPPTKHNPKPPPNEIPNPLVPGQRINEKIHRADLGCHHETASLWRMATSVQANGFPPVGKLGITLPARVGEADGISTALGEVGEYLEFLLAPANRNSHQGSLWQVSDWSE
jgi:hypothetical protein